MAFQNFFHQKNASARRVHLLPQNFVSRAGGQAKATVDATGNGMGHGLALGAKRLDGNVMLH
jgi:hypothetical protein